MELDFFCIANTGTLAEVHTLNPIFDDFHTARVTMDLLRGEFGAHLFTFEAGQ